MIRPALRGPVAKWAKRAWREAAWHLTGSPSKNPPLPEGVRTVLFVCLGNICRSPFAGALAAMKLSEAAGETVRVSSAGIKTSQSARSPREAVDAAARYGVSLSEHRPTLLTRELLEGSDLVVVMETSQLQLLRASYPEASDRIVLLSLFDKRAWGYSRHHIEDPFNMPPSAYDACYERIDRALDGLTASLRESKAL